VFALEINTTWIQSLSMMHHHSKSNNFPIIVEFEWTCTSIFNFTVQGSRVASYHLRRGSEAQVINMPIKKKITNFFACHEPTGTIIPAQYQYRMLKLVL